MNLVIDASVFVAEQLEDQLATLVVVDTFLL